MNAFPPIEETASWRHVPDAGQPFCTGETDVGIDDLLGNVKVIHNYTKSPETSAATEARVSPSVSAQIW